MLRREVLTCSILVVVLYTFLVQIMAIIVNKNEGLMVVFCGQDMVILESILLILGIFC